MGNIKTGHSSYHVSFNLRNIKARADVKSPHFLIWMALQDIVVISSGMKPVISPTNM
jgi:Pyruvate/2-oxoacid:ferredoxin oxidoreductase gamma subunit